MITGLNLGRLGRRERMAKPTHLVLPRSCEGASVALICPASGQAKRKTMQLHRPLLSLIATGGVAAALFGGNAVHTAFTSSASGTMKVVNPATVGTKITDGTITLGNAIPGDTGPTSDVTITNLGSNPEKLSIQFGTGASPALDQVVDVIWNGTDVGTLASLGGTNQPIGTNILDDKADGSNYSVTIPVALMLDPSANNSILGQTETVAFTITGTAANGMDISEIASHPTADGWDLTNNQGSSTPSGWNKVTNKQDTSAP